VVQSEETVAEVGGEEVTVGELVRQKEALSRFTGDSQPAQNAFGPNDSFADRPD